MQNADPSTRISQILGVGVALIWAGKPVQGLRMRAIDALLFPLSVMWLSFAIVWETLVVRSGAPFYFRLWGIPFILAGLFICIGRFFLDAYFRAQTSYGVDENKAYIVRDEFAPSAVTYALRSTVPINLKLGKGRRGTLGFGAVTPYNGFAIWSVGSMREFVGIPNASEVYRLVTNVAEREDR